MDGVRLREVRLQQWLALALKELQRCSQSCFPCSLGREKNIFTVREVQVLIQWWEIPAFMSTKAGYNIPSWKPPCFIPGDKSYGTTLSVHQMFGCLSLLSVFLLKTVFRERSSLWMNGEMLLNLKVLLWVKGGVNSRLLVVPISSLGSGGFSLSWTLGTTGFPWIFIRFNE